MSEPPSRGDEGEALSSPAVAAEACDTEYYLNWCGGYEEWSKSGGAEYAALYPGSLQRAGFREGEVLVDIGTGRGELLGKWIHTKFIPDGDVTGVERTYRRLAARRLTAWLGAADIWAEARKP